MIIRLVLCYMAFDYMQLPTERAAAASAKAAASEGSDKVWSLVILLVMVTHVENYAIGTGNVSWQQSDKVVEREWECRREFEIGEGEEGRIRVWNRAGSTKCGYALIPGELKRKYEKKDFGRDVVRFCATHRPR
ncbi:uncharacterized protein BDR25DRAFT_319154 [Lindgomyces ingoldianus]|uniref:Uncharacterized protein n=1 Tax=Lindgomyces ingoldianus TaxID=673940 RepID=A0ACB6QCH3_9PLEO|nr:uncharacterized protein BDR25DRAFT_319154 [Lindgomyces ingoldianus]KAF2464643.1 hypothetical protein BDR25DRAFT_319154 [Lindgomyces ingoldianus]